jgi:hypothetical protein
MYIHDDVVMNLKTKDFEFLYNMRKYKPYNFPSKSVSKFFI